MPSSAYTDVHVPKPASWEAFERGSVTLWRAILKEDSVQKFGRNGQKQFGIDLWGYRNGDASKLVAAQCKCKGEDEQATEQELRADVAKAIAKFPDLTEYYFTTTAPDHAPLQVVAMNITAEHAKAGRNIIVRVWGWGTLKDRIAEHPDAALAFDPAYSPFAGEQNHKQMEFHADVMAKLSSIEALVSPSAAITSDASQTVAAPSEAPLDAEIDRYRDLNKSGRSHQALDLLTDLHGSLNSHHSGHIWFRVKANIGHCHLSLGDLNAAAMWLDKALTHAPNDPKAGANRVLALILREDYQAALDAAKLELVSGQANEVIAGYAVQAAGLLGLPDPLAVVPEQFKNSVPVAIYYMNALRAQDNKTWHDLARAWSAKDPADEFFVRVAAEAEIDDIVSGDLNMTWALSDEEKVRLQHAADDLSELWSKWSKTDFAARPEILAICINACVALSALHANERAASLMREALKVANGSDHELLFRAGSIAMAGADRSFARDIFDQLEGDGPALLVKCQLAARLGEWDYLRSLEGNARLSSIPASEREVITTLVATASLRFEAKSGSTSVGQRIDAMLVEHRNSVRSLVLVARIARELEQTSREEAAYAAAVKAVVADTHIASRAMLADYAIEREDFGEVISLLDGRIDLKRDSDELLVLATAFAHSYPPPARAASFFDSFPASLRETEIYAMLGGVLHYHRGDLRSAEERFQLARSKAPTHVRPLLMLAQTMMRAKEEAKLAELIPKEGLDAFIGSPVDLVHLAQVLSFVGRGDEALRLGYDVLQANKDDPTVNLKFVGLVFSNEAALAKYDNQPVGVGMWARLSSDDGQSIQFLVVEGPSKPSDGRYSTSHPIVQAVFGLGVGDTATLTDSIGQRRTWKVEEVRHPFIHAHLDITEHFNTRFPGHPGFWAVRTQGDDVQPLLDIVRRRGERAVELKNMHAKGQVPLAMIAQASDGNVIAFAETLRAQGASIVTCNGNIAEREQAVNMLRRYRDKGVVLDAFTLWQAAGLGGLATLKATFGAVFVPQSVLDQINDLRSGDAPNSAVRSGTTYYHEGQFYYDEETDDRRTARASLIDEREALVRQFCTVVPAQAPDEVSPDVSALSRGGALDPIFVARERSLPLLSDDRVFRALAGSLGTKSAWLQVALLLSKRLGQVDPLTYASNVAALARCRHLPLTIDVESILALAAAPERRQDIRDICGCIGSEDADLASHVSVVLDAIRQLWGVWPVTLTAMFTTGMLLQNVIRFRPLLRDRILGQLHSVLAYYVGGDEYFGRWRKGHFLLDVEKQPRTRT